MSPAPREALHSRIRRDIAERIMSGAWPAGHRIPVEQELMRSYACSRMTVNKALRALVEAGLLESRKRAGTFVATPRHHRAALEIPDIRSEVAERGGCYRLELLSRARRRATRDDRRRMQGAEGAMLAVTCRHFADERPYALEHRLINLTAVPDAADADFAAVPPGTWLLGHVPWTQAEHRITAINADADTAALLDLPPGGACIVLERWTWRGADRITHARLTYPGDRHALIARFHA